MIIGIISDTHGALNDEVLNIFRGVAHIIHAGDIGAPEIVPALARVAPVTAVRGNTDNSAWSESLLYKEMITLGEHCFYVLHDLQQLDLEPHAAGISAVISGHTHQPETRHRDGVLYLNPGSASQRRHGGSLCVGRIRISGKRMHAEIIQLHP
ncbi:MAG: metallophosphoesterase family protein [Desulfatitalea sp.]|nr:metallophosphoesterase family protein [Desulfatitalea sp.]